MARVDFSNRISVDKEIVSLLSSSTYQRSLPYAIRELVSNAHDADATVVSIRVDRSKDQILVEDNGIGMSLERFKFFLRIAGQTRGRSQRTSKFERDRIGHFGIGFLAVFPFCSELEITSTTENSDEIFVATIPTGRFFEVAKKPVDVGDIEISGVAFNDASQRHLHYTRIALRKLNTKALSYFRQDPHRLKWELQEDLPLPFPPGSELNDYLPNNDPVGLEVQLNGETLYRNVPEGDILDHGIIEGEGFRARYLLVTPQAAVKPPEMRYLKLRVNNVGIGQRDHFGLGIRQYSKIYWISGEVQIESGLELTMTRDDFIITKEYDQFIDKLGELQRRWYNELELIDKSASKTQKQIIGGRQAEVASKSEVLERNVNRLVERGFEVEYRKSSSGLPAFSVDKSRKRITVVKDHPDLEDVITLHGKKYKIAFSKWKYEKGDPPCRLTSRRVIEVNMNFKLFASKRYGELFKRVYCAALISRENASSVSDYYETLVKLLTDEFSSF